MEEKKETNLNLEDNLQTENTNKRMENMIYGPNEDVEEPKIVVHIQEQEFEKPKEEIFNPVKQPNTKKERIKKLLKVILLILFFGATFYSVYAISKTLSDGNIASLKEILATPNPLFCVLLLVIVTLIFFTDGLKYAVASKLTMNKFDYGFNIGVGIMGRFYDNITPFGTGGQPYQVYMYYKHGYPASVSTVIPIVKYLFQLVTKILVSIVLYVANHDVLKMLPPAQAAAVASLTYIGITVASFGPVTIILFSLFPKVIGAIINFGLKIGAKLKILRDYDKTAKNVWDFLNSYRAAFIQTTKNIPGLIAMFVVSVVDFITVMSVPYFVIIALGKTDPSMQLFWDMVTLNSYSLFAASLVPTPGNTGAIEGVASMAFAPLQMAEGGLFWVVFIWRICTYYIYIFLGLINTLIVFIKGRKNKNKINIKR